MNNDTTKRVFIFLAFMLLAMALIVVCPWVRNNNEQTEKVDPTPAISQEEVEPRDSEQLPSEQIDTPEPVQSDEPEASPSAVESEPALESEPVVETSSPSETNQPVAPVINPIWTARPIVSSQPTETLQPAKNATVKINSKESIYGDPLKELDFTIISGNATYDDVAKVITLSKEPGEEVGNYRINVEFTNNDMGIILISEATYTIKPRPITVRVYNRSSVQGETLVNLKKGLIEGNLAKGDTLIEVIELTTEANKDRAGKYEIKVSIKDKNYDVTLIDENGKTINQYNKVWYEVINSSMANNPGSGSSDSQDPNPSQNQDPSQSQSPSPSIDPSPSTDPSPSPSTDPGDDDEIREKDPVPVKPDPSQDPSTSPSPSPSTDPGDDDDFIGEGEQVPVKPNPTPAPTTTPDPAPEPAPTPTLDDDDDDDIIEEGEKVKVP